MYTSMLPTRALGFRQKTCPTYSNVTARSGSRIWKEASASACPSRETSSSRTAAPSTYAARKGVGARSRWYSRRQEEMARAGALRGITTTPEHTARRCAGTYGPWTRLAMCGGVVMAKGPEGDVLVKAAKGVVLSCGGYEFNNKLKLFLPAAPVYFYGNPRQHRRRRADGPGRGRAAVEHEQGGGPRHSVLRRAGLPSSASPRRPTSSSTRTASAT